MGRACHRADTRTTTKVMFSMIQINSCQGILLMHFALTIQRPEFVEFLYPQTGFIPLIPIQLAA